MRGLLTESVMLGVGRRRLRAGRGRRRAASDAGPRAGATSRGSTRWGIDSGTLVFTLGLSIAAGLLFGVVPALQWSRVDLVRALNEGSAQSAGGFRLLRTKRAWASP